MISRESKIDTKDERRRTRDERRNTISSHVLHSSSFVLRPSSLILQNIKAYSLIEVLMAVSILSIGIIGVIGGFSTSVGVLEKGQENIEAYSLLREKMSEIEEKSLEENGLLPGKSKGKFIDEFEGYLWELDIKESIQPEIISIVEEDEDSSDEEEEEVKINEVQLIVYRNDQPRKYSVTTYMKYFVEKDEEEDEEESE